MKNYKLVESMLKQDFEMAKYRHDFQGMRDDYELLRELWATGELGSDEYSDGEILTIVHCFAEVGENKVFLPSDMKWCARNYGKKVIYCLDPYSVKLVLQGIDNELIVDYLKEESIRTKDVILGETVKLDDETMETLGLENGDIVELCIYEEMVLIAKVPQLLKL